MLFQAVKKSLTIIRTSLTDVDKMKSVIIKAIYSLLFSKIDSHERALGGMA